MKFVIMAGGGGTRLWPVSRENIPKQVQPFIQDKTLLQVTYERLSIVFPIEDIYVSTNVAHKEIIKQQIPGLPAAQLILEPEKKDTAPAIGFAALHVLRDDPEAAFVTINSDAYIRDTTEYIRVLWLLETLVEKYKEKVILVGIKPSYPETGYGYIKMDGQVDQITNDLGSADEIFKVERFVEKPDIEKAKQYVSQWNYLWNPALFCWKASHVLDLFKEHLPEHYEVLKQLQAVLDDRSAVAKLFAQFEPISIDYGIVEKVSEMLVVPADFGWADIGHWRTIKDVLSDDAHENLVKGEHLGIDTEGSLIYNYSDKLVATIGLKNMVVVETDDILLVCPKERSQDVKQIVTELKKNNNKKYL